MEDIDKRFDNIEGIVYKIGCLTEDTKTILEAIPVKDIAEVDQSVISALSNMLQINLLLENLSSELEDLKWAIQEDQDN